MHFAVSALALASLAAATATPARLAPLEIRGVQGYQPQDGACRPGHTMCDKPDANGKGGWCADLLTDSTHCGECNNFCADGFGMCVDGYCAADDPNACPPGWTGCQGGPGGANLFTCTDLQNDQMSCGTCYVRCREGHICKGGVCVEDANAPPLPPDPTCPQGFTLCDGQCSNTENDNNNCGKCRTMCDVGQNCVEGKCTPETTCPQDYCGGVGCVNKANDNNHCGKCFNKCAAGKNCWDGKCA